MEQGIYSIIVCSALRVGVVVGRGGKGARGILSCLQCSQRAGGVVVGEEKGAGPFLQRVLMYVRPYCTRYTVVVGGRSLNDAVWVAWFVFC